MRGVDSMLPARYRRARRRGGAQAMTIATREAASGRWTGRQFHNQPVTSHQHQFLVDLWDEVRAVTGGRVAIAVHAQNGGVQGSDPQALDMLIAGELEFMTLMGGILGKVVAVAEIQALPFAFQTHEQVHRAFRSPLGDYVARECAASGIHCFRDGLLENGFRHIAMIDKPITCADDLAGVAMRVPDGEMFRDLFTVLETRPTTVNINQLYAALQSHRVDGQENPLVVTEVNRLYEVTRYMSLTAHMWSGFNLLANLDFWNRLPADIQDVVNRAVATHVARQRAYTEDLNRELVTRLAARGMTFNRADTDSFRRKLGNGFYARWKSRFGATAWSLLEQQVGAIG
jgi:TRAP-type transport system periplasmic protein